MGKIALRALEAEDLPKLLEWRNKPDIRKFFREYRPLTMEHQQQWFDGLRDDRKTQMFAITSDDHHAGACGLTSMDWIARSAEISLYVGDWMVLSKHSSTLLGRGYIDDSIAPKALKLLTAYGFDTLGLKRLWAEIWDFDTQKQSLLTEAGFELEVTQRQAHWDAGWHDALIYGKLNV